MVLCSLRGAALSARRAITDAASVAADAVRFAEGVTVAPPLPGERHVLRRRTRGRSGFEVPPSSFGFLLRARRRRLLRVALRRRKGRLRVALALAFASRGFELVRRGERARSP